MNMSSLMPRASVTVMGLLSAFASHNGYGIQPRVATADDVRLVQDFWSWLISLGGLKMMVIAGFVLYLAIQGRRKASKKPTGHKGGRQVRRLRNPKRSRS